MEQLRPATCAYLFQEVQTSLPGSWMTCRPPKCFGQFLGQLLMQDLVGGGLDPGSQPCREGLSFGGNLAQASSKTVHSVIDEGEQRVKE